MVQRTRGHEESPPVQFLAKLRQSFQIEHFANWYTPTRQTVIMHRPVGVPRWSDLDFKRSVHYSTTQREDGLAHLKAYAVSGNGDDMIIPDKSSDVFALHETSMCMLVGCSVGPVFFLFFQWHGLPGLGEATT